MDSWPSLSISFLRSAGKVRTLLGTVSFATILFGCARPVEHRTSGETRPLAEHHARLNMAKEEKNDPYWKAAREEVYRTPEQLAAQDEAERRGTPLPKLIRGSHRTKTLLLTFDDGPHPRSTLRLLKILADQRVPRRSS